MNLGETIFKLRTERNMSQGDLANALDVSRQSISKWETNTSVPELDKLIRLSEIFDVSLDTLVLNKQPQSKPQQTVSTPAPAQPTRKTTAGIILLCFGALVWLLITLLGDILSGLVFALPFITCGLICLFVRKHTGLWCGWAVYCLIDLYIRYVTGCNWRTAFLSIRYSTGLTIQAIVGWVQLLCFAVLTLITVLRFRYAPTGALRSSSISAAVTWAIYAAIYIAMAIPDIDFTGTVGQIRLFHFVWSLLDCIGTAALVGAITFTIRTVILLFKQRKQNRI